MEQPNLKTAALPWVYYLVGSNYQSKMNPVQLSFHGIANSATFPVPWSRAGGIRMIFGTKQMRTGGALGPSVTRRSLLTRIASLGSSLITRNTLDVTRLSSAGRPLPEPDLIFAYDIFSKIAGMNRFSCPKAYFVGDASISVDRYFELAMVQEYDYVLIPQKDYVPIFKSRGCKNVMWLPFGIEPRMFFGPRTEEKYDFAFIGRTYPGHARGRILEYLKREASQYRSFIGTSPDSGALLRQSKIAVQISVGGVLGQRVFEVMATGAMLLADRVSNGLFDLFKENVHLACFSGERELVEKIEYFVRHDDERKRIGRAGQLEVMTKHTVTHRANTILKTCIGRDLSPIAAVSFPWFREDFGSSLT